MSNNTEESNCTLSDQELIERCNEWVHSLAKSGAQTWVLQVPVNFNRDPDMLFIELGKRYEKLRAENDKMRKALEQIQAEKRNPGEYVDRWAFNRCWHIATSALK